VDTRGRIQNKATTDVQYAHSHSLPITLSTRLLGDYLTGAMVARGGVTVMESTNEYGTEWQVGADEPQLFQAWLDPSASCVLPEEALPSMTAHRLCASTALEKAAAKACAHKSPDVFEFCILDFLATGDVGTVWRELGSRRGRKKGYLLHHDS